MQLHGGRKRLFIPWACAGCVDSLVFSGASSIPLCYVLFPATLLHQLFFHPLSPHLATCFFVYLSILFTNSYIIPLWEVGSSSPNIVQVIKSRRMRWAGHVVRMGEERGGCIGSWWRNQREGDHWGDLGVDGWIILGWFCRRWDVGI